MKKFFIGIICLSALAACNGEKNVTDATGGTVNTQEEAPAVEVKTLYGEISEVIGNAVVIKEIERPTIQNIPMNEDGTPDFSNMELPEGVTIGEDGRPDFSGVDMSQFGEGGGIRMFTGEGGMRTTPGEGGERRERPEGMTGMITSEGRPEGAMRRERTYTGVETEVFIPVGIPIMTTVRGEDGMEEKELNLTNLKSGDTISITYKEDGVSIDSVMVSQGGMMGGMMMGNGFGGPGGGVYIFNGPGPGGGGEVSATIITMP